jgi:hypothetical protein
LILLFFGAFIFLRIKQDKSVHIESQSFSERKDVQKVTSIKSETSKKAIRGWTEIAERTVGDDGFLLSFLKMAKGYASSDGKLIVVFSNDLAKDMVEGAEIKDTLCSVVNVETQHSFSARDVFYEVASSTNDIVDGDLDEFDE